MGLIWNSSYFYIDNRSGIPILMFKLGLVKKEVRYIGSTMGITLGVYTLIHFINVNLNEYFIDAQITNASGEIIKVNYMYSVRPEIPLLELFWSFIPYEYWYMLPVLLVILIYLILIYFKEINKIFADILFEFI